jgi:spore cortex formation protein SpoVR/YcgB (stage V sporulation)
MEDGAFQEHMFTVSVSHTKISFIRLFQSKNIFIALQYFSQLYLVQILTKFVVLGQIFFGWLAF